MAFTRRILSVLPANGWYAAMKSPDDEPHQLEAWPLTCWALVELIPDDVDPIDELPEREVHGMIAIGGSVVLCVPQELEMDTAWRLVEYVYGDETGKDFAETEKFQLEQWAEADARAAKKRVTP
jgi:hypothetical protein